MMNIVLLISRLALVAVFALSGAGKLADLAGSRRAVAGFRVPVRIANPVGVALPFVELALAVALLPALTAWWAALGSLLLLLGFTTAMVVSLARGEQPDCHCFGAIHSEPVSSRTVVRNVALAAVAALVVIGGWADPGPGAFAWLDDADPVSAAQAGAGMALMFALGVGAITITALYRRLGSVSVPVEEPEEKDAILTVPVGTPLPAFEVTSLTGERFVFEEELHHDRQLLLAFVNPACTACERVLPRLARWQEQVGDRVKVVAISHGGDAENRAKAERTFFPVQRYLVQDGQEVSQMFGVERVPIALHVAPDGTLMSPVAGGAEAIADLLDQITLLARSQQPVAPSPVLKRIRTPFGAGDKLPALTLKENGTEPVAMPMPGRQALMIFWSSTCPFCQRLLNQLRQWEPELPSDLAIVLVVNSGDVEATRAQGLAARIVEDDGTARAHYEVTGTPVGVLANPDGTLAAPMAIGLGAVQVLVRDAITRDANVMMSG